MAQMANRDPDSILFNWRLSGHTPAHSHSHTESSCEDGDDVDDNGGGWTVCVTEVLLL